MRVLFISGELIGADVCYRLKKEGCNVKLYIEDKSRKDCFEGIVKKTNNWKKELKWVGKNGLIVFDDVVHGKIQDKLIKSGYTVLGGCSNGAKLEINRDFAQKLFSAHGLDVEESVDFYDIDDAISYIEKNRGKWVVKQNGHISSLSYVGKLASGDDVISILKSYKKFNKNKHIKTISLQRVVEGVEVAVGRFYNGNAWTTPILINFEHKPFLDGGIGPLTAEMGTLAWYDKNENNKLFQATLAKIEPHLKKIDYRGFVDINCIVNEDKLIPLEATMRFGSPTNHLQSSMHISNWSELLLATARGEKFNLKYKKGYSIVVAVAIPPFPYPVISSDHYSKGVEILFNAPLKKKEMECLHFEEVSFSVESGNYCVAGSNGFIVFVTGNGETVEAARVEAYNVVKKIVLPKMMYRSDIGLKFIERDENLLIKWGWL